MGVVLRERKLKNKTGYYLDINHGGERWSEFLQVYINDNDPDKKEKKELLNRIRANKELELSSEKFNYTPKFKGGIDFLLYYQKYLDDYKKGDKDMISASLRQFKVFLNNESLPITKLDSNLCEKFKDFLKYETELKGETPQNYFARFKKVVKAAYKEGVVKNNPAEDIKYKGVTDKLRKEILNEDELKALVKAECESKAVKDAFLFSCFTGLGMAEIKNLTWNKINDGKIKLDREKTGREIWNDLPKSALKIIEGIEDKEGNVFKVPSKKVVARALKDWVSDAKITKKISYYCGRHTFAVQLLLKGTNIKTVMALMGHSNIRSTLKYLNYVDSLKTDAINSLPDIFE